MILRRTLSRRALLAGAASALAASRARPARAVAEYPFTLGVASGNPTANSIVLWTRLAPEPGRDYWYRFIAGGEASPIGHTSTAPARGAAVDRLRFGFVSCANYEFGHFSAYRHLAAERPDLVLFLGDYIYEHASRSDKRV